MTTTLYQPNTQPHEAKEFSDWHESCIAHLMDKSSLSVQREPNINGKTPDLLITPHQGKPYIIECIARLQDQSHAFELTEQDSWHFCGGNIQELHQNIFSRLDCKATKYREIAENNMPYIIALYDASCANSLERAMDMILSPYAPTITRSFEGKVTGKHYNTLWSSQTIPATLFELYPHLSGFIYSRWNKEHYYLPNPYASMPISPDRFNFAEIPKLPRHYQQPDWHPRPATVLDDYISPPEKWMSQMQRLSQMLSLNNEVVAAAD